VREMPPEDRPRERLDHSGAESLRDGELLAILFRTGTRELNAVALADRVLSHFQSLRGVARASIEEICQVKGIGRVKAIEIKAALELGKRLAQFKEEARACIRRSEDVFELLKLDFREAETEQFKTLLLNTRNEVLRTVEVSSGGLDATLALPRDVFRQAVREGAHGVIVCHNHPSGNPEPSPDDMRLTKRLAEAAEVIGLRFLDHVVFGYDSYVSFKDRGLM
jgi:DNA repair protein RadC